MTQISKTYQTGQRTVPGAEDVLGAAASVGQVSVNQHPSTPTTKEIYTWDPQAGAWLILDPSLWKLSQAKTEEVGE